MKKFLAIGVLALSAAIGSVQTASAWINFQMGAGFNMCFQAGLNPCTNPCGGQFNNFPGCQPNGLINPGMSGLQVLPMPPHHGQGPMPQILPMPPVSEQTPLPNVQQTGGDYSFLYNNDYSNILQVNLPGSYRAYDYNNYNYYPGYWFNR